MKKKLAVVIGRFQLPHHQHIKLIEYAHTLATNVVILVGSSNRSRSIYDPFSFDERVCMLTESLKCADKFTTKFEPLEDDLYLESQWTSNVKSIVDMYKNVYDIDNDSDVLLVGSNKDETSYYLNSFSYEVVDYMEHNEYVDISSTDIRTNWLQHPETFKHPALSKDGKAYKVAKEMSEQRIDSECALMETLVMPVNKDSVVLKKLIIGGEKYWSLPGKMVLSGESQSDIVKSSFDPNCKLITNHTFSGSRRSIHGDVRAICYWAETNVQPDNDDYKSFTWNEIEAMRNCIYMDHYFIIKFMRYKYSANLGE